MVSNPTDSKNRKNRGQKKSGSDTDFPALLELADKGADVDMLGQMVQFMAQRLLDMDVEGRCGAGYDEKTSERLNSRNGYRDGVNVG